MKRGLRRGTTIAILGCVVCLGAGAALPGAASAVGGARSCGSRSIEVSSKGAKPVTVPVSRIRVEGGATCAEAVKVISGFVTHEIPDGWAVGPGAFKVPHGLHAEIATNGHKKVKFAVVGPSSY